MSGEGLLIVGAGPAGLALSAHYRGPSRIIEAGSAAGGLSRSLEFGGCVFDIGGHSFHTPYGEVAQWIEALLPGGLEVQRRDARVWFDGALIDYPFQQNVAQVGDAAVVRDCLDTLPDPGNAPVEAADFEAWIVARFGTGIARHFLLPYNRKLWARDLRGLATDWVAERVAGSGTEPHDGQRQALSRDAMVGYPAAGGFGAICDAMADAAGQIHFGQRMVSIDPVRKLLRTASGTELRWDRLVSTAPLPLLLNCIDGRPDELVAATRQLDAAALKIVLIACEKAERPPPQRIYVADGDCPAHKIAFNHRSSHALRQRPREAVIAEISHSATKPAPDDRTLATEMIDWLADRGLIGRDTDSVEARVIDVPYGYPVPTHDRAEIVATARAWLEPHGIHSIGRFGGWAYINSDACIHEAMELAGRL